MSNEPNNVQVEIRDALRELIEIQKAQAAANEAHRNKYDEDHRHSVEVQQAGVKSLEAAATRQTYAIRLYVVLILAFVAICFLVMRNSIIDALGPNHEESSKKPKPWMTIERK